MNKKWDNIKKINLLFLSHFIKQKGYMEFLEGFFLLPEEYKKKCNIIFAGSFYKKKEKKIFLKKIKPYKNIQYLGFIDGIKKREVLHKSHALFLPTYYDIEAQPLSILESYAAGLTVFTTDQGGINDIFKNKKNGDTLEKKSALSVKNVIIKLIDNPERFKKYAVNNRKVAEQYSKEKFISNMNNLFNNVL
jgi:glycosyltransferase involved in cell wall biosynthesis